MSKGLKMRAIVMLALAVSMAWWIPSCRADGTECSQPCKEVLPQPIDEENLQYLKSYQQDLIPLLLDEEQYEYVSLAGLSIHPERYNGKKVRVSGYLRLDHERNTLCDRDPVAYCMWVDVDINWETSGIPPYQRLQKFARTGERISVRGVFDANMQPYGNYASITDIVEVMGWNTKRIVFADPSDKKPHVWTEEEVLLTNPIIPDPERHDGKVVLVYGYISDYPFQMCPSLELYDTGNCIDLWHYDDTYDEKAARENKILSEFIGKRAYVRGVFDASKKSLGDRTSGSIVKLIEIFEENGPVRFKPHIPNKAEYYPASP
ncbi:MAG: hypothetical protein LBU11_11705 [Zoogloeaceae bacterium]|jgi:hypothetical protein|nr:hypothetical protein [Zoogloeaceae bacterium]